MTMLCGATGRTFSELSERCFLHLKKIENCQYIKWETVGRKDRYVVV